MQIKKTFIENLLVIEPELHYDGRGFFFESYNKKIFEHIIDISFVQENESSSSIGTIRGLHFQKPPFAQAKLIRCINGKILDVVIDLRSKSKNYGQSFSIELSSDNKKQLFIPKGFAHGFQVLSDIAVVSYKVDEYYNPKYESGLLWNDKDLSINWKPLIKPILSKKDLSLNSYKNFKSPF